MRDGGARVATLLGLVSLALTGWPLSTQPIASASVPSVVLVLTDDQRWDTLWSMPTVQAELIGRGITFSNAMVVNPLCCPSRTSILTGQLSHSTGVYTNHGEHGGFAAFDDGATIATALHDVGYHTGLVGKYLNGYVTREAAYVPPGWDRWVAYVQRSGEGYYGYTLSLDGVLQDYGSGEDDYITDVLAAEAAAFIRSTDPGQPLFLQFSPPVPHSPAIPALRHGGAFSDLEKWRPPSYNEADVSDKPAYIRNLPRLNRSELEEIDRFRVDQYRTLLAVDEAVAEILSALEETGRLPNTAVVFASDNGILWGEHRWSLKVVPYEEDIRIPLVVRFDPLTTVARTERNLVLNVDLAPTFTELAGAALPGIEGTSLVPLLASSDPPWRRDFLVEHLEDWEPVPTYCMVRSTRYTYVAYRTDEEELYDLWRDPFELTNVVDDPRYAAVLSTLRQREAELCQPPPPG